MTFIHCWEILTSSIAGPIYYILSCKCHTKLRVTGTLNLHLLLVALLNPKNYHKDYPMFPACSPQWIGHPPPSLSTPLYLSIHGHWCKSVLVMYIPTKQDTSPRRTRDSRTHHPEGHVIPGHITPKDTRFQDTSPRRTRDSRTHHPEGHVIPGHITPKDT
ncbi:hypothetical protein Pcinc_016230 [Petrolisthes cinctipes]|uniref:Uncharacterized protein n=1 Tax=Petrolisthes cinctipes TaxID=88211 RepID=A0AAE1KPY2_PETCI|nr:hypothetical protein Pcinc_016230 [Petrolisthes cinctipes]